MNPEGADAKKEEEKSLERQRRTQISSYLSGYSIERHTTPSVGRCQPQSICKCYPELGQPSITEKRHLRRSRGEGGGGIYSL